MHIGHLFGALQNRVALQDEYDTFVIIADVQALTDNFEHPEKVRQNVYEVAMDNLAVGIDPEKSTIFIQSLVPEIAELTVFYSNLVTVARLERNPTVKEEIKQKEEFFKGNVTYGFLGYPVSQAADITAFQANLVPVGEDQLPMIEQTREIARKFNNIYGKVLVEPEAKVGDFPRIRGLDGRKMSKSFDNAIYLADEPEVIRKKVSKAITDTNKIRQGDPGNPSVCTVFEYHNLFSGHTLADIQKGCKAGAKGCVDCKTVLSDSIIEMLSPIRERRRKYEESPKLVEEILIEGTKKAKQAARETMKKVREAMKLDYF